MGNIVYDTLDNEFRTDRVAESIVNILNQKYGKEFQVVRIGDRYGTGITDEVTAICTIPHFNNFLFKVIYNMVTEKIVYDNFLIRCTCYYLEKEINVFLENVDSIVRVEISKKNSLDGIYNVNEFLEKYSSQKYVATLVISEGDIESLSQELLEKINEKFNGIRLVLFAYEIGDTEYKKFISNTQYMDHFSTEYIDNYKYKNNIVLKLEDNSILKMDL